MTQAQPQRRKLKYISPSGLSKYKQNPEDFYLRYLSTNPPGDEPQTKAMSIGSAFDAYAKNFIHEALFGKGNDPKYEFNAIFEAQVQPQWRDWARLHGMYVFENYRTSGALADLMLELQHAANVPKFEIEITGVIHSQREGMTMEKGGVVFLGKPDVFFINKHGAHVIIDWKVNGYCSKNHVSPMAGYVRLRQDYKKCGHHKECKLMTYKGVMINGSHCLEEYNESWATQLSIYSWLAGTEVGEEYIAGIDQICCAPTGAEFPDLRIAEHRMKVSSKFQHSMFELACNVWDIAHSDHFFKDLTKEESQARCEFLDQQSLMLANEDPLFLEMTASHKKWF